MQKLIVAVMTMFAVVSCDCLTNEASADGFAVVRHSKKVRHARTCSNTGCVVHRRFGCPEYYPCYPLYGAYGPYGGQAFWGAYTDAGWGRR
jgi:hypothetical protein